MHPRTLLLTYPAMLVGILLFLHGFLLNKVELDTRSACSDHPTPHPCWTPTHVDRVVWIIIDALRYDFAITNTPGIPGPYAGRLTAIRDILHDAGGLPTFFDVSQSFASSALQQDTMLHQLGNATVVMGDDTWLQLFPPSSGVLAAAHPYPSLVVRDLHTVDDGVWTHLLPTIRAPASWRLLIAHYLGVDHAGHTFDVGSAAMLGKLDQMDAQLRSVVGELVGMGGPGQLHERTLLLVCGDHGQTLTGDHGGASAEETDSPLLAVHVGRYAARLGRNEDGFEKKKDIQKNAELLMPQINLAPTLMLLMGRPVPFGSVGKVHTPLWNLATGCVQATDEPCRAALTAALQANAAQVARYLRAYAAAAHLPAAPLAALLHAYQQLSHVTQDADTIARLRMVPLHD